MKRDGTFHFLAISMALAAVAGGASGCATNRTPAVSGFLPSAEDLRDVNVTIQAPAAANYTVAFAKSDPSRDREHRLLWALAMGTHAYQVLLASHSTDSNIDRACYASDGKSDQELQKLVDHQAALLHSDIKSVREWLDQGKGSFDPALDLEPLTKIDGDHRVFKLGLPYFQIVFRTSESIALLYQLVLEVERDGDRLQDLYRFLIGLNLPVYSGEKHKQTDAELLEIGRELEKTTCASPFATDAAAWQIAGRKVWNWGEKNTGARDAKVLAHELIQDRAMKPVLKKLGMKSRVSKVLGRHQDTTRPLRYAVIGHSFTNPQHWSTPSAFAPVVREVLSEIGVPIKIEQYIQGGMDATWAYSKFFEQVAATKPDRVYLAVITRGDTDADSVARFAREFKARGIEFALFDVTEFHDPYTRDPKFAARAVDAARKEGAQIVPLNAALVQVYGDDRASQLSLDGVHMKEAYHMTLARAWLQLLAN